VQVIKDPLGTKGARLTTHITIPSRYLVFMPGEKNLGVSQKIEDEAERQRLKDIVLSLCGEDRVVMAISSVPPPRAWTRRRLQRRWSSCTSCGESIQERAVSVEPGNVIHEDLPLTLRVLRDLLDTEVEKMRIDSRETYQRVDRFVERFIPELREHIEYYPGERPVRSLWGGG
jgi:ribonuclease G